MLRAQVMHWSMFNRSLLMTTEYVNIQATGIPDYAFTITSGQITWLNNRPNAATDFRSASVTTATAGDTIEFGADINYDTSALAMGRL